MFNVFNTLNRLSITCLLLSTVILVQTEYSASANSCSLQNPFCYYGQRFAIEIAVINITPQTETPISAPAALLSLTRHNPLDDETDSDNIVNIGGDYEGVQEAIQALQKTVNVELLLPIHTLKTNYFNNLVQLELGNNDKLNHYSFTLEVFPRRNCEKFIDLILELRSMIEKAQTESSPMTKDTQSVATSMQIQDRDIIALAAFVKGHLIEFKDKKNKDNIVILIGTKLIDSDSQEELN